MSAEQGDVEAIREALNIGARIDSGIEWQPAKAALDRLAAALERAERERADLLAQWSDYKATTEDVIEAIEARAEKAERALADAETCRDQWIIKAGDHKTSAERAAWEDMRAYNIRLEERARDAERALAAYAKFDDVIAALSDVRRDEYQALRAALSPSEETSDES